MNSQSLFKNCRACNHPMRADAAKCPECGSVQRIRHLGRWICGAIFALIIIGAMRDAPPVQTVPSKPDTPRDLVTLDYDWRTKLGGSIMEADFTVNNKSNVAVKDVQIVCTHYSPSGTRIDSNSETLYEIFPAHKKVRRQDINMGFIHSQAKSTSCEITKFSPVANP